MRFLINEADPRAYGDDTRSVPGPKRILWLDQKCETCEEFIKANRSFYFPIASAFNSNLIAAAPKLDAAKLVGSSSVEIKTQRYSDNSERVSYLVLALGFTETLSELYRPIVGLQTKIQGIDFLQSSDHFETVTGYEQKLGIVGIARRMLDDQKNPTNIFLLGPLTGDAVVGDDETEGIEQNKVSYAVHNWRSYRFAEALQAWLTEAEDSNAPLVAVPSSSRARSQRNQWIMLLSDYMVD